MLTGRYARASKQNEMEAFFSMQRDRAQKDGLPRDQMTERKALQLDIEKARTQHARQVLALYRDAAQFRRLQESRGQMRETGLDFGR